MVASLADHSLPHLAEAAQRFCHNSEQEPLLIQQSQPARHSDFNAAHTPPLHDQPLKLGVSPSTSAHSPYSGSHIHVVSGTTPKSAHYPTVESYVR